MRQAKEGKGKGGEREVGDFHEVRNKQIREGRLEEPTL